MAVPQFRLPNINAEDLPGQMTQFQSYMRQFVQELQSSMNDMDKTLTEQSQTKQQEPFTAIQCYPVGAIYISVNSVSPQRLFGGKWEQLKDRFLLAAGDTYNPGQMGGEAEVRLNTNQIPSHNHGYTAATAAYYVNYATGSDTMPVFSTGNSTTGSTGGGAAHNNMPPFLAVYVWKRVA